MLAARRDFPLWHERGAGDRHGPRLFAGSPSDWKTGLTTLPKNTAKRGESKAAERQVVTGSSRRPLPQSAILSRGKVTKLTEFTSSDFFALAAARLRTATTADEQGDHVLNPDLAPRDPAQLRPAAVLVPIIDHGAAPTVILTRRREGLAAHGGQIAFPGGKVDPSDADAIACALREAEEEIGLAPSLVETIGLLPTYATGSGFRVTPVVARVAPGHPLTANEAEVAMVFEVPLAFLMDTANHRRASRVIGGVERHFTEIPFGDHLIWGATAAIIRSLRDRVFGP
jgi:8-oxo-dGTP pyrophosphatase MutT (NUDIX family)